MTNILALALAFTLCAAQQLNSVSPYSGYWRFKIKTVNYLTTLVLPCSSLIWGFELEKRSVSYCLVGRLCVSGVGLSADDERHQGNRIHVEVIVRMGKLIYLNGSCVAVFLSSPSPISPKWAAIKLSIFTPLRPTTSPQSPVIIYLFLKDINQVFFLFPLLPSHTSVQQPRDWVKGERAIR